MPVEPDLDPVIAAQRERHRARRLNGNGAEQISGRQITGKGVNFTIFPLWLFGPMQSPAGIGLLEFDFWLFDETAIESELTTLIGRDGGL